MYIYILFVKLWLTSRKSGNRYVLRSSKGEEINSSALRHLF